MKKLSLAMSVALGLTLSSGSARAELMADRVETYGNHLFALAYEIDQHGALVTGRSVDREGDARVDVVAAEAEHHVRALGWLAQIVDDIAVIAVCEHHGATFDMDEVTATARAIEAAIVVHADRMNETRSVDREESFYADIVNDLLALLHDKHKALERQAVIFLCEHGAATECR